MSEHTSINNLTGLQSAKSTLRLDQIASLRARGVGDHIDLPQLVVCGDQSAGKSSVLEGITGIPFPRQDGVCTKFATEIILQHTALKRTITATILPHSSRTGTSKDAFRSYRQVLEDFHELPQVIAEVGALMGIRGFGGLTDGPAFTADVLRIEVTGNTGLHLTVVDLPGLIAVANEEQTEDDVRLVGSLVDSYLENSRTIIIAVVQANNDIANQGIIQRSRQFDKAGERTVGVITKPDLINKGTEARITLLAKNQDSTKLRLGFFLLKNPAPSQLVAGITMSERQRDEERYFRASPWKDHHLDMDRVGIVALKTFLQTLLDRHIERELPKVREEIRSLISATEQDLANLGDERSTPGDLRIFLSRLSMQFHNLTTSALNGTYHETDSNFFGEGRSEGNSNRLRAQVHRLNGDFADYMRENARKRKVVNDYSSDLDEIDVPVEDGQLLVTEQELKQWVKKVISALSIEDDIITNWCPGVL